MQAYIAAFATMEANRSEQDSGKLDKLARPFGFKSAKDYSEIAFAIRLARLDGTSDPAFYILLNKYQDRLIRLQ